MEPDDLLCSRNARPEKALVGRAQYKINQPPSLETERASLEGERGSLVYPSCSPTAHRRPIRLSDQGPCSVDARSKG